MDDHHSSSHSSPIKRRWIGLGAASLVGLAALAWASQRAPRSPSPTDEAAGESSTRTRASARPAFGAQLDARAPCAFETGTRMAYAVTSRTSIELDMSQAARQIDLGQAGGRGQAAVASSEATTRDIERDWLLELEAIAREDGSTVLAARIQDRGMRELEGQAPPAPSRALSDTFLIRVDARCSVREFGWRSEGDLSAAREQQVMAAGLGFWAPPKLSEAAGYGATAFDMSGSYSANYVYEEGGHIKGEIVRYSAPQTQVAVLSSSIEAQLEAGQWFRSLSNERDLELAFHGVEIGTHFRSTKAQLTELGDFAPEIDLDDGGWSWGRIGAGGSDPTQQFDPALAELPFSDALAQYRELADGGTVSQYGALLRDWLRANPDQTSRVLSELRAGAFADDQKGRGGLFYALSSAGTPEASEALVALMGVDERVMHQISAAHALAMVAEPTAPMLDAMRDALGREQLHVVERGSLALALGTFAGRSDSSQPELAAAAREEIAGWLRDPADSAGSPGSVSLSHALLAAGNAGHEELAPSISAYIDHADATVRRSATHAMRSMSPETAFPVLERSLEDEDQVVRTSALETAAKVAQAHAQAPTLALRELAESSLGSEHMAERAAAVTLLDAAAEQGDALARETLTRELHGQLDANDPQQLALLANSMSGQWKAD